MPQQRRPRKPAAVLTVPPEQRHLPRRDRQFPFRPLDDSERAGAALDAGQAINGVNDMVWKYARRSKPRWVSDEQLVDIVQEVRVWLWQQSLPRYDAWRRPRVKVSTFLHRCILNRLRDLYLKLNRERHRYETATYDGRPHPAAADCRHDDAIERLAAQVRADPGRFLSATQTDLFRLLEQHPGISMVAIAKTMGYAHACSLSMLKRRMLDRIISSAANIAA